MVLIDFVRTNKRTKKRLPSVAGARVSGALVAELCSQALKIG